MIVTALTIRPARDEDREALASILVPVIRAGETYALDRDLSEDAILSYWLGADRETFVAAENGHILGTYYLRKNQAGGGSHVANCGYVTDPAASGRGIARTMAEHSFQAARERGFAAMQFNFVVSTNERAVRLWRSLGFAEVGRLPRAFRHPVAGEVDALVMYRML
ncbi:Ribosomal protein S18 acetylase RimI [Fulvimarina manganoxydans]|uniref:Ribosomal protein S18 acetylase RimI n=1 Tax=Fulvimarina manganoxydans TaxID=937218 RepID=A0A1W2CHB0_9HYPH|nr:Ribosomal protein S18 acetylase RimI [Fulvimarina manganoxydans]